MIDEPDLAILLVAANRCLDDRLVAAVRETGARDMRPAFGFVIRAVAAEEPTVGRLAELLGVSRQAASKVSDEMVRRGYLLRAADPADRRRTRLRLSAKGRRVRERAAAESEAIEEELRDAAGARAAGGANLVERAIDVARLGVDPARGGGVERDGEALAQRVERGRADAVVGRQAGYDDAVNAALAQERGEVGAVEARVAL